MSATQLPTQPPTSAPAYARMLGSTGWLVAGRVVGSLCTLLVLLQLARGLELAEFGRLTFYLAVMAVMGSVADLGTGQTVVQQSSSGVADLASLLRTGRQVRGVTALACTAAWA
ncbi:MAG TPA: hypothetical protein PLJ12_07380, partial [Planctomycetota bacterium]|nr:hypothetical protein [Planctomycetota bacterium]